MTPAERGSSLLLTNNERNGGVESTSDTLSGVPITSGTMIAPPSREKHSPGRRFDFQRLK